MIKKNPNVSIQSIIVTCIIIAILAIISWYSSKKDWSSGNTTVVNIEKQDEAFVPNNYITITRPDGVPVKASSKFSNLLNYITDGNTVNNSNNDSTFWKNKFKEWREKMINNTVAPTPANFMDIIELSKVLSEK